MGTDIEKLVDLMIQERMQSQFHKRGNMRISSVFPTSWIYGSSPLFSIEWFLQTGTEP